MLERLNSISTPTPKCWGTSLKTPGWPPLPRPSALTTGHCHRLFGPLVRAVVGQLISGAAARATFNRLEVATQIEPERILSCKRSDELLALGVPRRKGEYLHGLSKYTLEGQLDALADLSDAEVTARLVALRGVGVWTAEMFLIFALGRPDVWPLADMGVVRAAERYYELSDIAEVEALGRRFRPHRSAAVWYLWRWIEANPARAKK